MSKNTVQGSSKPREQKENLEKNPCLPTSKGLQTTDLIYYLRCQKLTVDSDY